MRPNGRFFLERERPVTPSRRHDGTTKGAAHPPADRRAGRAGVQPPGLRRRLDARPRRRDRPREGRHLQPLRLQGAARARGVRLRHDAASPTVSPARRTAPTDAIERLQAHDPLLRHRGPQPGDRGRLPDHEHRDRGRRHAPGAPRPRPRVDDALAPPDRSHREGRHRGRHARTRHRSVRARVGAHRARSKAGSMLAACTTTPPTWTGSSRT